MEIPENELQTRIKRKGIIISRMPSWAKDAFIERAKLEFADDYGMCLASMIRESNEYLLLKQKFFNNQMDVQLILNNKPQEVEPEKDGEIKAGNGRIIRKGRSS